MMVELGPAGRVVPREFGISRDSEEQIIEFVCDSPHQHPQGLQFLRLPELGFQIFLNLLGLLFRRDITGETDSEFSALKVHVAHVDDRRYSMSVLVSLL